MFLDTSGLLCLQYDTEPLHALAVTEYAKAKTCITHNYIIAEYVALATARKFPRSPAIQFVFDLLNAPNIEVVWIDKVLHQEAVELLITRPDKTYSLCDAVSFVAMRRRSVTEALTTDRHFEQEGFVRLLKT